MMRHHMGHEKEPKQMHGKRGGRHPLVHSHSKRIHRKVGGGRKR